jgi:hypothetical protein
MKECRKFTYLEIGKSGKVTHKKNSTQAPQIFKWSHFEQFGKTSFLFIMKWVMFFSSKNKEIMLVSKTLTCLGEKWWQKAKIKKWVWKQNFG